MKPDHHPDIVETILMQCRQLTALTDEQAYQIERSARHQFGGDEVYIPKTISSLNAYRISQELSRGKTSGMVAKQYGIARATIYNILKREKCKQQQRQKKIMLWKRCLCRRLPANATSNPPR